MENNKKIITTLFLISAFFAIVFTYREKEPPNKIIKIKSANEFYIDFNSNGVAEDDEMIQMYHVRAFGLNAPTYLTSRTDSIRLAYLADNFAQKNLLNKTVSLIYDKNHNLITVKNGLFDYSDALTKNGLGLVNPSSNTNYKNNTEKIAQNINDTKKLNLVVYNPYSKKYHKLDCEYAFRNAGVKIKELAQIQKSSRPCKICHPHKKYDKKPKTKKEKYPHIEYETYSPAYKDSMTELYLSDFTRYYYPSNKCVVTACQSLLREIKNANSSIDFAIYGVANQPELTEALKSAKKRGVKIRWVYDLDGNGNSIYSDTKSLAKILSDSTADIISANIKNSYSKSIMHNKFFIFDNKKVWVGSANISDTDMSGFNSNAVILIKSPVIAKIYKDEFEQMHNGNFHRNKSAVTKPCSTSLQNSKVSVHFSPQDRTTETQIIPLVKNAKKYIYMPVFVITHKNLIKELVLAKQRGVDVKIILDATGANNRYSPVKSIRESGIPVKTENRAGKMHMKSILIDDKYTILGSMNFSKSGESYNDENVLIIENTQMTIAYKNHFLYLWKQIPDKWLTRNPMAESFMSINSCFDGIDNDFDGKIDMQDDSCNFKLRIQPK